MEVNAWHCGNMYQANVEPKKGAAKCLLMPKEDEAVTKVLESATKVKVVIKWLAHTIICFIK